MFYRVFYPCNKIHKYLIKDLSVKISFVNECLACRRKIATYDEKEGKHRLLCDGKGNYQDFLDATTSGKNYIYLSDEAMDAIVKNSVSGIKEMFCCMAISGKFERTYHKCDITGKISLNEKAMFLKKKNYCEECGQFEWNKKGIGKLIVDENSWNGYDICRLDFFENIFICAERFKNIFHSEELTGLEFEAIKTTG